MSSRKSIYSVRMAHYLQWFHQKTDVLVLVQKLLKAYSAVIRLSGSNCNIWVNRSDNSGVIWGNNFYHFCLDLFGNDLMYLIASSFDMYLMSFDEGVPKTEIIRWTWSKKSSPGKSAVFPKSSAAIQPTDHTSIAFEYSLALRITSGALYHLVTTYSVFSSSSNSNPLASPKSHIFSRQFLFWV